MKGDCSPEQTQLDLVRACITIYAVIGFSGIDYQVLFTFEQPKGRYRSLTKSLICDHFQYTDRNKRVYTKTTMHLSVGK